MSDTSDAGERYYKQRHPNDQWRRISKVEYAMLLCGMDSCSAAYDVRLARIDPPAPPALLGTELPTGEAA